MEVKHYRGKVIPELKVSEMEFIDERRLKRIDLFRNCAICSTGRRNEYRVAFIKGQGGTKKEETWNEKKHMHTCCKSKVPWRHKYNCPRLNIKLTLGE